MTAWIVVVVGSLLALRGLYPPRRGETPHCRKCDYNLTALTANVCPECGVRITADGVCLGERKRHPIVVIAGLFSVFLGMAWITGPLRRINWEQFTPTGWLIADLRADDKRAIDAGWELRRRFVSGVLPKAVLPELIDVLLEQYARQVASMDVILRSSERRARETVDLFETWLGQLVFKDIEVSTARTPSR